MISFKQFLEESVVCCKSADSSEYFIKIDDPVYLEFLKTYGNFKSCEMVDKPTEYQLVNDYNLKLQSLPRNKTNKFISSSSKPPFQSEFGQYFKKLDLHAYLERKEQIKQMQQWIRDKFREYNRAGEPTRGENGVWSEYEKKFGHVDNYRGIWRTR